MTAIHRPEVLRIMLGGAVVVTAGVSKYPPAEPRGL